MYSGLSLDSRKALAAPAASKFIDAGWFGFVHWGLWGAFRNAPFQGETATSQTVTHLRMR